MQRIYRDFAACCTTLHDGLTYGHGWFRASDLSRVKRCVMSRESARSACKSADCLRERPETALRRYLPCGLMTGKVVTCVMSACES